MCHLQPGSSKSTLDVEALVGLTAVQYALVAADLLGNIIERLDDPQSQLLALLILRHCDVFNMANYSKVMDAVFANGVSQCHISPL